MRYRIIGANCVPNGLLYCLAEDCEALEGAVIILVDYGYLQGKAGG